MWTSKAISFGAAEIHFQPLSPDLRTNKNHCHLVSAVPLEDGV
jgi:hypothetical protein